MGAAALGDELEAGPAPGVRDLHGRLWRAPSLAGLAVICAVALAVRLFVAVQSVGSNDVLSWRGFAALVAQHGVVQAYVQHGLFNHPPLMGLLAAGTLKVSLLTGWRFELLFKLMPVLASVAAIPLVHRYARLGTVGLLLFALNPIDVLISAYHGSTDSLCAFLSAFAVMLAQRARPFACGLALAAALNVKLIPVVLIVPLGAVFAGRDRMRYLAGLGLGVLPFLPPLLLVTSSFVRNVLFYKSFKANWGIGLFVIAAETRLTRTYNVLWAGAQALGKPLILGFSAALGLFQARLREFRAWELGALALAAFLVFAPGFGIQYMVYPTALLMIADRRLGFRYIVVGGLFVALVYYTYWTRTFPPFSNFQGYFDRFASLFGFVVWLLLLQHLARAVRRVAARVCASRGAGSPRAS